MGNAAKWRERNSEIVTFFYLIFGHRIHQGVEQDRARKEAYDAVSLRYGLSRGRLLNIISERNYSQDVNKSLLFRDDLVSLISDIKSANEELELVIQKNERLITLLNGFLENEYR